MAGGLRRLTVVALVGLLLGSGALCQEEISRKVRTRVEPRYPELARNMHLSGTVKIQVVVTPTGSVKSTKVIGGHPVLVDSALAAVEKWKFEAGPSETTQVIVFNFRE